MKDLVAQNMRPAAGTDSSRQPLTVMSTDVEDLPYSGDVGEPGFSELSCYLEHLNAAVSANRGMVDSRIGNSVMALWNAAQPNPDHVANACKAALQVAAASRALTSFRTRIGVHTGTAVAGDVGARDRVDNTPVSAVANQATRLRRLNKVYGTEILVSSGVAQATERHFVWRDVDWVVPADATEVLEIHEPLGLRLDDRHESFLMRWKQGQEAYRDQRFVEAVLHFEVALELRPNDGPCQTLLGRCEKLTTNGVAQSWDGAWRFDKK